MYHPEQIVTTVGDVDVSTTNVPRTGWETVLFYPDGTSTSIPFWYANEKEATDGHWKHVSALRAAK